MRWAALLVWLGVLLLLIPVMPLYAVYWLWDKLLRQRRRIDSACKAVFITGCDTGFGNMLSKRLASKGVRVFAGCLFRESLENFLEPNIEALECDVTKEDHVTRVLERIRQVVAKERLELWGIVNNAGIADGHFLDFTPVSRFQRVMEVNFLGTVAVAKAFLPLLKQSRGRIVNVASIAGRISAKGMGPYCSSKFAVEAFSDAIRQELKPFGIQVCIIEPGFHKTPIVTQRVPELVDKMMREQGAAIKEEYGDAFYAGMLQGSDRFRKGEIGGDPTRVIDAMEDALLSHSPNSRYLVGLDAFIMAYPMAMLPAYVCDYLLGCLSPSPPIVPNSKPKLG